MRIFRFMFTIHLALVSWQCYVTEAGKSKGCKGDKNRWRLKLLRRLAALHKGFKYSSLKNIPEAIAIGTFKEAEIGQDGKPHVPSITCDVPGESGYIPCPSADARGRVYCISEHTLCDKTLNCPNGEDEDLALCMFYNAKMGYIRSAVSSVMKQGDKIDELEMKEGILNAKLEEIANIVKSNSYRRDKKMGFIRSAASNVREEDKISEMEMKERILNEKLEEIAELAYRKLKEESNRTLFLEEKISALEREIEILRARERLDS